MGKSAHGSITQGILFPYDIYTTLGVDSYGVELLHIPYPNPTTDFLIT